MLFSLFKRHYYPLNTVEISSKNLLKNYAYLSQFGKIAPVFKSNAYGHGLTQIAKILDSVGAPFFCVDSIHEGYQLLKARVKTPVLIMGYINPENLQVKKLPFSYAVYTEEMLHAIKKYQPHAGVHIFVDSGMHREGVPLKDVESFVKETALLGLKIEGLMSHFAMADKPKDKNTSMQVSNFQKAQHSIKSLGIAPKFIHIAASSGILHAKEMNRVWHDSLTLGNVGRTGIALYGIDTEKSALLPVLQLTSTIAQIKMLKKGDKVGYDFTFTAKKDMKIAILPIGYNDGVNRKLSNKGFVKIGNMFSPIIGRVSMNITTIDITGMSDVYEGTKVVLYSDNPKDKNSIQNTAKICGVIPYEILVQLHASTKRVVV